MSRTLDRKILVENGSEEDLRSLEAFAYSENRGALIEEGWRIFSNQNQLKIFQALVALQEGRDNNVTCLKGIEKNVHGESYWSDVIKELKMHGKLKSWQEAGYEDRKRILSQISDKLGLDFSRLPTRPTYGIRRNEMGATDLPSSFSEKVAEEILSAATELALGGEPDAHARLSEPFVMGVLSNQDLLSHLREHSPKILHGLLRQATVGGAPGLPEAITLEPSAATREKFGNLAAHRSLTIEQMERLPSNLRWSPEGLEEMTIRLHAAHCKGPPGAEPSPEERRAFLEALGEFLSRAPASANWLRAQQLLSLAELEEQERGFPSAETVLGVLRLARTAERDPHGSVRYPHGIRDFWARLTGSARADPIRGVPGLTAERIQARQVEQLIIAAVAGSGDSSPWGTGASCGLLDERDVARCVAEGMLLSGCEDERRWEEALEAAGRDPEQLRSRSELRFAPESKREFLPGGEVVLRALVKNCGSSVTAKVYELNAWNHCRGLGREPDAEVALDGLCATHELTVPLREASPYVLQRVDVAIPQISGRRGVFVVELIEAGLACRALVRVGYISAVQEATPAGHALLLFWEDGSVVQGGKVWLNHEVHEEGERAGVVLVPFAESPAPGQQAVLGCRGSSFAGMFTFDQREERYELTAGMFMEGESLVSKAEAPLIVRAQLHIHGTLVPVSLLSEVTLSVTTKDAEGTERVHKREVGKAELERSPELFLSEAVSLPERPMQVRAVLRGRVRLASRRDPQTGEPEVCDLAAEESWTAPGASEKMVGVYFSRVPDGFCLLVKGRAGEAVAGAVAAVTLQPHAFDLDPSARRHGGDVLTRRMQTDGEGCIRLGQLVGFKRVCVRLMGTPNSPGIELRQKFEIPQLPSTRHDDGGAPVVVPALRDSGVMVPAAPAPETPALTFGGHRIPCEWAPRLVSLSLLRGDERAVEDLSARCLSWEDGFAVLRNLPPGEYRLWAEPGRSVRVTAMADSSDGRLRLPNGARWLSDGGSVSRAVGEEDPLRICSFAADSEQGVSLSLGGSDSALAGARVCLALTTFTPDLGAAPVAAALRPPGGSPRPLVRTKLPPASAVELAPVHCLPAEVRYVHERRQAVAAGSATPGTLLEPPSLLVRPAETSARLDWHQHSLALMSESPRCLRSCNASGRQRMSGERRMMGDDRFACTGSRETQPPSTATFEFCAPPVFVCGLRPDRSGEVRVGPEHLASLGVALGTSGHAFASAVVFAEGRGAASGCVAVGGSVPATAAPVRPTAEELPLSHGEACLEPRRVNVLEPGGSVRLSADSSARLSVVDCSAKVWGALSSLLPVDGSPRDAAALLELDFLQRWSSLGRAEKLRMLAEHPCHEVHLFVALRDPETFRDAVLPWALAKSPGDCDFMDRWLQLCPFAPEELVQDREPKERARALVEDWGRLPRCESLNAAERVLLALVADSLAIASGETDRALELRDIARRFSTPARGPAEALRRDEARRFAAVLGLSEPLGADLGGGGGGSPVEMACSMHRPSKVLSAGRQQSASVERAAMPLTNRGVPDEVLDATIYDSEPSDDEPGSELSDDEPDSELPDAPEAPARGERDGDGDGHEWLLSLRRDQSKAKRRFRPPGPTRLWQEGRYRPAPGAEAGARPAVPANGFWGGVSEELAVRLEALMRGAEGTAGGGGGSLWRPLAPRSFAEALARGGSDDARVQHHPSRLTAALLAFAFTGMPAEPGSSLAAEGPWLHVEAGSAPAIVFSKSIEAAGTARPSGEVVLSRRLFEGDDPAGDGPLVAGRCYTHVVFASIASPRAAGFDVVCPIPQGAIPLDGKPACRSVPCQLEAYGSMRMRVADFYFPHPTEGAKLFPASAVSPEGSLLACTAPESPLQVLPKPSPATQVERDDWKMLSAEGSDEEVIEFLRSGNVAAPNVDLADIVWRAARSRGFTEGAVMVLSRRRMSHRGIFQCALLHGGSDDVLCEALTAFDELRWICGPVLSSPLVSVEPADLGVRHTELWPFIRPREHNFSGADAFGSESKPVRGSDELRRAYATLLSIIARRPGGPRPEEALAATHFLALKGELDTARTVLRRFVGGADGGRLSVQRAYAEAWLALREPGGPSPGRVAAALEACGEGLRSGAAAEANPRWRRRWAELSETLDELRGVSPAGGEATDAQHRAAAAAPFLSARAADGWKAEISADGLQGGAIEVRLYPVDAEILFTMNPFSFTSGHGEGTLSSGGSRFSIVAPAATFTVAAPAVSAPAVVDLSPHLSAMEEPSVVVLEASAGEVSCNAFVNGGRLRVQVAPQEGVLYAKQASGSGASAGEWRPAVAAYCKVYARSFDGGEAFYKDGYTDVLGRFDYASRTGPKACGGRRVSEMACIVVGKTGCAIRQLDPPPGI